jgi:hypothetical protein
MRSFSAFASRGSGVQVPLAPPPTYQQVTGYIDGSAIDFHEVPFPRRAWCVPDWFE